MTDDAPAPNVRLAQRSAELDEVVTGAIASGTLPATMGAQYAELKRIVAELDSTLVAFSGGIDSSLVAYVAGAVLGDRALAVTSGSPSLKRSDLALSKRLAVDWGMPHRVIVTDELTKPDYRANPTNRCFHCKTSLYDALANIAKTEGFATITNGTNTDDLGDHRPGLVAAADYDVRSPLVEAKFDKSAIRALAAVLGLENANKPQAACLSSRFPYGSEIDRARLAQVEAAEAVLEQHGFTQFRVRHHEEVARVELPTKELARAVELAEQINTGILAMGYRYVALDLKGFRSGSLNEGLIEIVEVK